MHIHISGLYETVEPIIEGINACGDVDKVILITSEKCKIFYDEVKKYVNRSSRECEAVYVDIYDYNDVLMAVKRIYENERALAKEKGYKTKFSLNITGGTKIMAAAESVAAHFISGMDVIYIIREESAMEQKTVHLPLFSKAIPDDLSKEEKELLGIIKKMTENG